jgi:hypothetical protein
MAGGAEMPCGLRRTAGEAGIVVQGGKTRQTTINMSHTRRAAGILIKMPAALCREKREPRGSPYAISDPENLCRFVEVENLGKNLVVVKPLQVNGSTTA